MFERVLLMVLLFLTSSAQAISVSSYIYEMEANEEFIAKSVTNDTAEFNTYRVSVFKIDRPGPGGENILYQKDRELIFAPLFLNIPAGQTDYFKLLYIGPKDDQERYYRVDFLESKMGGIEDVKEGGAQSVFVPSISFSTIFIVRPRKQNLKYDLNEQQGYLKNIGNTTFRLIVSQGCDGSDEDAIQFYMLPGEEYRNDSLKGENKKFIVANKKYMPIGSTCKEGK